MRFSRNSFGSIVLTLTVGIVPSAAQDPTVPRTSPRAFDMTCGDERVALTVDGKTARVSVGGRVVEMVQTVAASGARYEAPGDPTTTLWNRGDVAMLVIGGQQYPECRVTDAPFTALGHEPGWRLDIAGGRLDLHADYGKVRVSGELSPAAPVPGGRRYQVATTTPAVTVTVLDRVCRDSATGMPRPHAVELSLDGRRLDGCGGDPALLLDGAWIVTDLAGSSPVTGSTVSMRFDRDGRLSGSTGCNNFSGKYTLTGEGLGLSPLAMTRKACAPELMTQEQTVARLLEGVTRFDVDDDAGLTLLAGDVRQIVIRRAPDR